MPDPTPTDAQLVEPATTWLIDDTKRALRFIIDGCGPYFHERVCAAIHPTKVKMALEDAETLIDKLHSSEAARAKAEAEWLALDAKCKEYAEELFAAEVERDRALGVITQVRERGKKWRELVRQYLTEPEETRPALDIFMGMIISNIVPPTDEEAAHIREVAKSLSEALGSAGETK
jgi:hypothetical protein